LEDLARAVELGLHDHPADVEGHVVLDPEPGPVLGDRGPGVALAVLARLLDEIRHPIPVLQEHGVERDRRRDLGLEVGLGDRVALAAAGGTTRRQKDRYEQFLHGPQSYGRFFRSSINFLIVISYPRSTGA